MQDLLERLNGTKSTLGADMQILLLGGSGYLGAEVKSELIMRKFDVTSPSRQECNLTKSKSLVTFLRSKQKFDVIINCAVFQKTGDYLVNNASEIILENTLINASIAEAFYSKEFKFHLITIGASCAFSNYNNVSNYFVGEFHQSVESFALTKRHLAQLLSIHDPKMFRWTILVPGTLVGPGEQLDSQKKHFFNGTIFRFVNYQYNRNPTFSIFGDMSAERDLATVNSVANDIVNHLDTLQGGIINLKSNFRIKVGQLYESIEKLFGDMDHVVDEDTNFKAQEKKSVSLLVDADLTNTDALENQNFRNLVLKTQNYYRRSLSSEE